MFELNETLEEFRVALAAGSGFSRSDACATRDRLEGARENFSARLREIDDELRRQFRAWDEAAGPAPLERIRGCLGRRSYLLNLVRQIDKALE